MNCAPAVLGVLCAACSAQHTDRRANSEPSLAETRSWIADRLPTLARSRTDYQPGRTGFPPGLYGGQHEEGIPEYAVHASRRD
jgi:hypothetical protein